MRTDADFAFAGCLVGRMVGQVSRPVSAQNGG